MVMPQSKVAPEPMEAPFLMKVFSTFPVGGGLRAAVGIRGAREKDRW